MSRVVVRVEVGHVGAEIMIASVVSRDAKVCLALPLNAPLRARMHGRSVAFFWLKEDGHEFEIGDEAPPSERW